MKDFLEVLDVLLQSFYTIVVMFLAGIVSALLVVSPRGQNDLDTLFGVAVLFVFFIFFPLCLFLVTASDRYFLTKKYATRKMSDRQIKTNRVEKVGGSLSLASGEGGTLQFSESEGALSEVRRVSDQD